MVVLWALTIKPLKVPGTLPMKQGIPWFDRLRREREAGDLHPSQCDRKRRNSLASAAEWIAHAYGGTDVALMLGIAHTLVENGWQDDAFWPFAPAYDVLAI